MCLTVVHPKKEYPESVVAYKVFRKVRGGIKQVVFSVTGLRTHNSYKLKIGYRYTSTSGLIQSMYPAGFHCLKTRDGARKYKEQLWGNLVIHKVKISKIVTSGKQAGQEVLVARHMTILEGEVR